ncbi:unnamed protein product [Rhizoctonia solani]|uniref:Uncharacterized protein n=1 Tax=Rhizoctonia solani TaxID=456999 RepID=A0A8H2WRJ2_9AGAM|nr:unnamed protein product [Rhizoctonia solani]
MIGSSAELFRNELSQRLCADADFSLPNANILVGVIIDAMEYNLSARYHPLARTTIQNVLKVSEEIECLGRILQVNMEFTHRSVNASQTIAPFMLRTLHMLAIPATSLLNPCPEVVTLMTYVEVVHRLSAYIGPRAVYNLVRDFNMIIPRKFDAKIVTKVPGTGPRVARRYEAEDAPGPVRMGWRKVERPPYMTSRNPHAGVRPVPFPLPGAHPYAPRRTRCWDSHGRREPPAVPMPRPSWKVSQPTGHHPDLVIHQPHPIRHWEALPVVDTTAPMLASKPSSTESRDPSVHSRASSPYPYRTTEVSTTNGPDDQSLRSCSPTIPSGLILEHERPETALDQTGSGADN